MGCSVPGAGRDRVVGGVAAGTDRVGEASDAVVDVPEVAEVD